MSFYDVKFPCERFQISYYRDKLHCTAKTIWIFWSEWNTSAKNWIIIEAIVMKASLLLLSCSTWLYSTDKLKDLPETTEQKSKALILVIASRHLKESWVFSRVFHLFSMKWQLTRQLISINWRLISETSLVRRRCNWNNYGPITIHSLVGESFSSFGSIRET